MAAYKQYRRKQIAELRAFEKGDKLSGVSISDEDKKKWQPKNWRYDSEKSQKS